MLRQQDPTVDPLSFLRGKGEMATRIRAFDWASHPFGPPEDWPQSLKSALSICLQSAFPTAIYWGRELRLLYNDAWAPIPGPRHPAALGAPAREVWADIWHVIEPQFRHLITTGESVFVEDQMLPMARYGAVEETYWDYSFTPIRGENGMIAGIFNSGSETTADVRSRRDLAFQIEFDDVLWQRDEEAGAECMAIALLGAHLRADAAEVIAGSTTEAEEWGRVASWQPQSGDAAETLPDADALGKAAAAAGEDEAIRIEDVGACERDQAICAVLRRAGVAASLGVPWPVENDRPARLFLHVHGTSRHWSDFDIAVVERAARRFRAWHEHQRSLVRERAMMREIDHRARNALAVVQSVVRLTTADDMESFRAKIDDRISALSRAHSLLSEKRWQAMDFRTLLAEELEPYLGDGGRRVSMRGPPVDLPPEMAQTMALVLHELATNAAKHGALKGDGGALDVSWALEGGEVLSLQWTERNAADPGGGSADANPGDGFGSRLIDRVVTKHFGGTVRRTLTETGLHCALSLSLAGDAGDRADHGAGAAPATAASARPGSVLIVEDEAIVAIDLEDMVTCLGYSVFGVAASVEQALATLDGGTPDLAVLDMNLSGKQSRPVAEALDARGVPFVYATGYDALPDRQGQSARAPHLTKPITEADLAAALAQLRRPGAG